MSVDIHPGSLPAALHEAPATVDDESDLDPSWSETAVTVIAAMLTIGIVSFVAVLMALA